MSLLWNVYCAYWSLWFFIALETASVTTMGFVFRRTLAGYRPSPSYRRLLDHFAADSS